jgi:septum site-determining protein MinC
MVRSCVTIKGTREGLLISIDESDLDDVAAELADRLDRTGSFFRGGRATLEVGSRALTGEEIGRLQRILAQRDVNLRAVLTTVPETQEAVQALGLQALESLVYEPMKGERDSRRGLLVRRTLRSGQRVEHPGHVVVIGDVNPGAEITAGGDIVVWGKLRGVVHAGAQGDDEAVVCALSLAPTLLRIGNYIARAPDSEPTDNAVAEMARVSDGIIVAEPWQEGRSGGSPIS